MNITHIKFALKRECVNVTRIKILRLLALMAKANNSCHWPQLMANVHGIEWLSNE